MSEAKSYEPGEEREDFSIRRMPSDLVEVHQKKFEEKWKRVNECFDENGVQIKPFDGETQESFETRKANEERFKRKERELNAFLDAELADEDKENKAPVNVRHFSDFPSLSSEVEKTRLPPVFAAAGMLCASGLNKADPDKCVDIVKRLLAAQPSAAYSDGEIPKDINLMEFAQGLEDTSLEASEIIWRDQMEGWAEYQRLSSVQLVLAKVEEVMGPSRKRKIEEAVENAWPKNPDGSYLAPEHRDVHQTVLDVIQADHELLAETGKRKRMKSSK